MRSLSPVPTIWVSDPSDLSLWRAIFPRKQSKCVDGIKRIEMTKMHLSRSLFAPIKNNSNLFR